MAFFEDNSISHDITLDAGFRAWAQKIHDGLSSVGLVQTADTGQITIASATTPASNNTFAGYEIWRFADADQASEPVYIKIQYGRGAAVGVPALSFQAGRGSNGSGTLTNASSLAGSISGSTPGATPFGNGRIHIAHAYGGLCVFSTHETTQGNDTSHILHLVERLRDETGALISGALARIHNRASQFDIFSGGAWEGGSQDTVATDVGSKLSSGKLVFGGWRPVHIPAAPLRICLLSRSGAIAASDTGLAVGRTYKRLNCSNLIKFRDNQGSQGQDHNICPLAE